MTSLKSGSSRASAVAACSLVLGVSLAAQAVVAAEITILAGHLPPMVDAAGQGREAEVIRTVLGDCGHEVTFEVFNFTSQWKAYANGRGDAVATVPLGMELPGQATQSYVHYQNGITTRRAGEGYADLAALSGKSVVAFKGAQEILPGLKEAIPSFGHYSEVADQINQNRQLHGKRADAVIGYGMIFSHYNAELGQGHDAEFHAAFAPSPYVMNFRDPALAREFDRCLASAEASGKLEALNHAWAEKFRDTLGNEYLGF